jgi:hypothetical protein
MNKEDCIKLTFLTIFFMTFIFLIIGIYMVRDTLLDLNLNSLSYGIDNINGNLKSIDNVLNNLDVELVKHILIRLNKTLTDGINPTISLSINNNIPESIVTNNNIP